MPTFTAVSLDRLLEPGAQKSVVKLPPSKLERGNQSKEKKVHRPYGSPALYTTPEATPLPPDSPTSFPPSPYIINHKRRGPRLLKSFSENDIVETQQCNKEERVDENGAAGDGKVAIVAGNVSCEATVCSPHGKLPCSGFHGMKAEIRDSDVGLVGPLDAVKLSRTASEKDSEREDFFDPQDSMSVASNSETDDNTGIERSWKNNMPPGEFFDACEELSAEGISRSSSRRFEAELHEIRLNLLLEIERRKQVEQALDNMKNQWQSIGHKLSLVGFTLPAPPVSAGKSEQLDVDLAEDLSRQVVLARVVANSIGRGCAKAEVEVKMESQIESKNFEITRLLDRLHYYEAMNREMSQRNQEVVEMARRQRNRRKRRQRWVWTSIGLAITLGSAAIAWSYLPSARGSSVISSSNDSVGDATTNHEQVK